MKPVIQIKKLDTYASKGRYIIVLWIFTFMGYASIKEDIVLSVGMGILKFGFEITITTNRKWIP